MGIAILLTLAATVAAAPHNSTTRRLMCADLCSSGLGGSPCGEMCNVGVDMATHLKQISVQTARKADIYGPRRAICPSLCLNNLGNPLCNCQQSTSVESVDWPAICETFCEVEGYTLYGCSTCHVTLVHRPTSKIMQSLRRDGDFDWGVVCASWCSNGDGGAACNCDIIP